jgi:hypothetical protein
MCSIKTEKYKQSDKIWPHFAALKLTRTHKWELVDKGVIKKVFVIAN